VSYSMNSLNDPNMDQQLQKSTFTTQPTYIDAAVGYTHPQLWDAQYLGLQELMATSHCPPTSIVTIDSSMGMAAGFPTDPSGKWNPRPRHEDDSSWVTDPFAMVPHIKGWDYKPMEEQVKHLAAPTLASARDQNIIEATTSHRGSAVGRAPRYARPRRSNHHGSPVLYCV